MTDEAIRRLERAAQAGDAEAAVQLLRARIRAGELSTEHVALAAHLGDPSARMALGPDAPPPRPPWTEDEPSSQAWFGPLRLHGPAVWVRAQVAMLRPVVALAGPGAGEGVQRIVDTAAAWLVSRGAVDRAALERDLEALRPSYDPGRWWWLPYACRSLIEATEPGWTPTGSIVRTDLDEETARAAWARFEAAGATASLFSPAEGVYGLRLERCGPRIITCIKEIRQLTGKGLKESKDLADAVRGWCFAIQEASKLLGPERLLAKIHDALVPVLLTPSSDA